MDKRWDHGTGAQGQIEDGMRVTETGILAEWDVVALMRAAGDVDVQVRSWIECGMSIRNR